MPFDCSRGHTLCHLNTEENRQGKSCAQKAMVFSIVAMIAGIMLNIILIVFVIRFYILLPKEIAAPGNTNSL